MSESDVSLQLEILLEIPENLEVSSIRLAKHPQILAYLCAIRFL
jgi:hypothetical protein